MRFAKAYISYKSILKKQIEKKMRISLFLPLFCVYSFQKNNADDSLDIFLSSKGSLKNAKTRFFSIFRKNGKSEIGEWCEKRADEFLRAAFFAFWKICGAEKRREKSCEGRKQLGTQKKTSSTKMHLCFGIKNHFFVFYIKFWKLRKIFW